ncbi:MAG: 50S ribosomal protein L23 [Cyclobacteriaceae bacterium]
MDILIRPLITEKAAGMNEEGKFSFIVDKRADKLEIKAAVEKMYSVNVLDVNTINTKGKPKSRYSKTAGMVSGRTKNVKKAIVQLAEGQIIDFYSEV